MTSPIRTEVPPPTLEEVTDGIFAYIQLHGQWGLNNAGFLVGADAVTLIDTCFTERRARALADAVKRTTGERPVRTLINTHHHGDHTYGNFVFGPGVTIIGHEKCREEVIATGLSLKSIWPDVDWGEIDIVPPNVTFSETLTVYVDDLRVELIYVGPAHTTNDIVAWVPEKRTLFTGDVVFNGGTPFTIFGSIAGSIDALDVLRTLNPERVIPGHGPVCGPEVFDGIEAYLRFVQDTAERGFNADATPLDLARDTDLGPFAELHDTERFVANLHRAYSELRGESRGAPIPLFQVMPDMVAYNGGEPPRCLA
jgi:cyclase